MQATTKTEQRYLLTVDREEAEWLKRYVQNPTVEDESEGDSEMRSRYFHAIERVLGPSLLGEAERYAEEEARNIAADTGKF